MAPKASRIAWKGSLKLSLIAIPIRVYPATTNTSDVSFRQLHRRCHTPIQLKKWCPHCNEEVGPEDIVKGYESAKGQYVVVEEEDVKALRPESTRVIELSHTLDAAAITPIDVERAYYVTPDSKPAGSAFAVIRDALDGQAGIGHVALHGREYLVAVKPLEGALVMYTLRTAGEVRPLSSAEGLDFAAARSKPDEVRLAKQVLASLKTTADLSQFTDRYEEALREMIAKKAPEETVAVAQAGKPSKVVDLMHALRQSLATINADRRRPSARASAAKASVIPHPSSRKTTRRSRRAS